MGKPDAGISGRSEFIASFEHRSICFRAPTGTEGEGDDGAPYGAAQSQLG
jgi:hypothetical protein